MRKITGKQLAAVQSLYAKSSRSAGDEPDPRAARLAWAASIVGRAVSSFSDLSSEEAATLIDSLKRETGQTVTANPERKRAVRSARAENVAVFATADDLRTVHLWREGLGWSLEQLDAWLASSHSPTRGRKLLTRAACRATVTALRAMVRRRSTAKPAA